MKKIYILRSGDIVARYIFATYMTHKDEIFYHLVDEEDSVVSTQRPELINKKFIFSSPETLVECLLGRMPKSEHTGQTKLKFEHTDVEAVELKPAIPKGELGFTTTANPPYTKVESIFNGHTWVPLASLEGKALYSIHHDVTAHDPLYTSE